MSDIRKYITIVESMKSGLVQTSLRDEDIVVSYTVDSDGEVDWYIDDLGVAGTRALDITPEEDAYIRDDCVEDMHHSW